MRGGEGLEFEGLEDDDELREALGAGRGAAVGDEMDQRLKRER